MKLTFPVPVVLGSFLLFAVNFLTQPALGILFISLVLIGVGTAYFIMRLDKKMPGKKAILLLLLYSSLVFALLWMKAVQ